MRARLLAAASVLTVAALAILVMLPRQQHDTQTSIEISSQSRGPRSYQPTDKQWAMLAVETVEKHIFRTAHATEGKISINEDRATPVFSPYPGRVTRLLVKPGDAVTIGQPLFFIEAADMVQAQNEFLASLAGLSKAKSRVDITEIIERQNRKLFDSRAGSLREWQQAQADLAQAQSELRTVESTLEATRNRLRILGKTDSEIEAFQQQGRISPETPIYAPIAGTVVQRKVGPGQYVSYTSIGSTEPVFTIGDLSTVWLVAYIRESEAQKVRVGQQIDFTVLAQPDQVRKAQVTYVAAALDSTSRRLMVRATIDNAHGLYKPEMFANVTLYTDEGEASVAVPRDAVIFEGDSARVWVLRDERTIEMRRITTGATSGKSIQVRDGLKPGDRVISKGGLFIERASPAG